jgi:hypothetical protein
VRVAVFNEALFSPPTDGRIGDLEVIGEFPGCKRTARAKTLVMTWQVIAFAEIIDSGSFEWLAFPSHQAAAVEDFGDLLIAMIM